jgi:hypothetical protein
MTLGNMGQLRVRHLIASCLNDACLHQGLIDVSKYPDDTEVHGLAYRKPNGKHRRSTVTPIATSTSSHQGRRSPLIALLSAALWVPSPVVDGRSNAA